MRENQIEIIENYIQAYNAFDTSGMVKDLHSDVVFENITNGAVDMTTMGIKEFKTQAEKAKDFFSERKQTIDSWDFKHEIVTIDISYEGVLAKDIPGAADAGDTLTLTGQSEFTFSEEKIISIKDKS